VTVTGGTKQGKCKAEATAHAKAGDVEDSEHDLKVVEGDGCSAKAESRAVVKPQKQTGSSEPVTARESRKQPDLRASIANPAPRRPRAQLPACNQMAGILFGA
jgi:hypothetical protein